MADTHDPLLPDEGCTICADQSNSQTVTHLLQAARHGDARAFDQLLPMLYDELRGIAA